MGTSADKEVTPNDDSFSRIRALGRPYGTLAADSLYDAYQQLRGSGANSAAKRLLMLDAAADLDSPSLEKLVPSDSALDEVLEPSRNRVRLLSISRTALVLVSVIFTLLVLALAVMAYQHEVEVSPGKSVEPFLLLWSQQFGGHFAVTLPDLILVDVALLILAFGSTLLIDRAKKSGLALKASVTRNLDAAMGALALATTQSRVDRPPASAEEWAYSAQRILADAMEQTRSLAAIASEETRSLAAVNSQASEAITEASRALADTQAQTSRFIEKLSRELTELTIEAREHDQEIMRQTAKDSTAMVQSTIERQIRPILDQLRGVLTEFGAMREVVERFTSGSPRENSAELGVQSRSILAELEYSQAVLLRSQQELHDEVNSLIDRLSSAKIPETAVGSAPDASADPSMLATSSIRRPLWQAFTDGLGGVFDVFGGIEHTRPVVPTLEEVLADDAHALCLALGLVPEDENGGGEGVG